MMRALLALFASCLLGAAQEKVAPAHFHHIHLNTTDPDAAIAFYTRHFDCERKKYEGSDAVFAQKSWLLFTKVDAPPAHEIVSAIWHFGWGAEDMPAEYRHQLDLDATFNTPITDISGLASYEGFYFAYIDGPDHALIELNTAAHHRFGHIHLLSEEPIAAGDWYVKNFGALLRNQSREPAVYNGFQVAPSASLQMDNVNILIYPMGYAQTAFPYWKGRTTVDSTKGRVVDHIAFSVDDVPRTMERLRRNGVKIIDDRFVEGPDRMLIELVPMRE